MVSVVDVVFGCVLDCVVCVGDTVYVDGVEREEWFGVVLHRGVWER